MTDELPPIEAPIGERCMFCLQEIEEGDNGLVQPGGGRVMHRECTLRSNIGGIGHLVDHRRYCRGELGVDAGLSFRTSALLVWNWWQLTNRGNPTDEQRYHYKAVLNLLRGEIDA